MVFAARGIIARLTAPGRGKCRRPAPTAGGLTPHATRLARCARRRSRIGARARLPERRRLAPCAVRGSERVALARVAIEPRDREPKTVVLKTFLVNSSRRGIRLTYTPSQRPPTTPPARRK
ncbi:unnamed protein product [Pieris macdunnoughi]|uniref:Uncharacterized protein n=1 Tax=Pieris macdunnoughi TaxID=345717 RepID=A0A821XQS9_9NEOP|nr:unnamed protein product [Pieris macdunnoughi]